MLDKERTTIIETFEKHLDKIKRGAIYFIGMALWGPDISQQYYPINLVLKSFKGLL